jgi:hypothetical protein
MAVNISRTYDRFGSLPGDPSVGRVWAIGGKHTGTIELAARTVHPETIWVTPR